MSSRLFDDLGAMDELHDMGRASSEALDYDSELCGRVPLSDFTVDGKTYCELSNELVGELKAMKVSPQSMLDDPSVDGIDDGDHWRWMTDDALGGPLHGSDVEGNDRFAPFTSPVTRLKNVLQDMIDYKVERKTLCCLYPSFVGAPHLTAPDMPIPRFFDPLSGLSSTFFEYRWGALMALSYVGIEVDEFGPAARRADEAIGFARMAGCDEAVRMCHVLKCRAIAGKADFGDIRRGALDEELTRTECIRQNNTKTQERLFKLHKALVEAVIDGSIPCMRALVSMESYFSIESWADANALRAYEVCWKEIRSNPRARRFLIKAACLAIRGMSTDASQFEKDMNQVFTEAYKASCDSARARLMKIKGKCKLLEPSPLEGTVGPIEDSMLDVDSTFNLSIEFIKDLLRIIE